MTLGIAQNRLPQAKIEKVQVIKIFNTWPLLQYQDIMTGRGEPVCSPNTSILAPEGYLRRVG